ncbi:hypothetical protein ACFVVU_36030 [Kitasatospora sp. NPDC057965]|uniref:hypothetical protein n=1 Tax=Kitasatospora sp. NPDC057965 TaxID=3346291 RepID=UPI0036DAC569
MIRYLRAFTQTLVGRIAFFSAAMFGTASWLSIVLQARDMQPLGMRAAVFALGITLGVVSLFGVAHAVAGFLIHGLRAQLDRDEAEQEVIHRELVTFRQNVTSFRAEMDAACAAIEDPVAREQVQQAYLGRKLVFTFTLNGYEERVSRITQNARWRERRITAAEMLTGGRAWRYLLRACGSHQPGQALTSVAARLAGSRHAHLREAWQADLAGAPEYGIEVTPRQARLLGLGFVLAGLKLRLRTLGAPLWVPLDWF